MKSEYSGFVMPMPWPVFINISQVPRQPTDIIKNNNSDNILQNSNLHKAAQQGNIKAILIEINNGTDINIINNKGHTPLHQAIFYRQIKSIEKLIYLGANTEIRDSQGHTARDLLHQYPDIQTKFDIYIKNLYNHNIAVIKTVLSDTPLPIVLIDLIAEFIGGEGPWLEDNSGMEEATTLGESDSSNNCCIIL